MTFSLVVHDPDTGHVGVDANGGAASFTGELPEDWKGHRTGQHYACQGNRLAGPEVLGWR